MVNHAQSMLRTMKSVLESSVRSSRSSMETEMQPEPGRYISVALGASDTDVLLALARVGKQSALPGVQPAT